MNNKILTILLIVIILGILAVLTYFYSAKNTLQKTIQNETKAKTIINTNISLSTEFETAIQNLQFNPELLTAIKTDPNYNADHRAAGIPVPYPDYTGKTDKEVQELFQDYLINYVQGARRYQNISYSVTYILGALDTIVQWGSSNYISAQEKLSWKKAFIDGKALAYDYTSFITADERKIMTEYLDLYFEQPAYIAMERGNTLNKPPITSVPFTK